MNKKVRLNDILEGISVSFALSFLLFLYAPLELYSTNKGEFWYDIYILLPYMLVAFCILFVMSVLVFWVMKKCHPLLYKIGVGGYFVLFICTYVQGTFLIDYLPVLDGTWVNWDSYAHGRVQTIVLWLVVAVIVICGFIILKTDLFHSIIKTVSICMTLMLTVTLISICITNQAFEKRMYYMVSTEEQFEMSNKSNFIILVLDAVDSASFNKLLEATPEYQEMFSDFTYYRNTVSGYPYTTHSVPHMLSGYWYEYTEPFQEYVNHVYKTSTFFERLESENYKLGLYEAEMTSQDESIYRFENIYDAEIGVSSWWYFAKLELKFIGFRYAPFDLKKYCMFKPTEIASLRECSKEGYEFFTSENPDFYEDVLTEDITYVDDKNCFKFIHIEGAHIPFRYDKNVNLLDGFTDYAESIQAALTITQAYLDKLKRGGVYDNSVIMVMADHGYSEEYEGTSAVGRQNPILLIKGFGETHELQVSEAPVSHDDLMEAYNRLLDGKSSMEVFDYHEGDQRERRYIYYMVGEEEKMIEYMQTGHASDLSTLFPTGREFDLK